MLTFPPSVRIFVATVPTDLRRSFDSLAEMTRQVLGQEPLSGHLYVYRNRAGDRVKILFWDRTGFVLWYKRLERGTFRLPREGSGKVEVSGPELALLLEGIELAGAKRRVRYSLESTTA